MQWQIQLFENSWMPQVKSRENSPVLHATPQVFAIFSTCPSYISNFDQHILHFAALSFETAALRESQRFVVEGPQFPWGVVVVVGVEYHTV